jgi:hypothetical protein
MTVGFFDHRTTKDRPVAHLLDRAMRMLSITAGIAIRRLIGVVSAGRPRHNCPLRTTIGADRIGDRSLDFQHKNLPSMQIKVLHLAVPHR